MVRTVRRWTYVTRDGIRLVADQGGPATSPCVILLHGGGQTRHSWHHAVQELLKAGFQVINFDSRGHGESDWSPDGAYSLADRSADLATITDRLDVPFILVGASLGGATAVHAVHDGVRPAGLVLVDIVPEPEPVGINRVVEFMSSHRDGFATIEEAARAVSVYNPHRRKPANPDGLMKNLRERENGRLYWHWDPRILDMTSGDHRDAIQRAANSLEDMPDLPVLLVRGLSSDVVGDAGVEALRRRIPWLEVVNVADAGHMIAGDRNDAFVDGVIAFAGRIFGTARH